MGAAFYKLKRPGRANPWAIYERRPPEREIDDRLVSTWPDEHQADDALAQLEKEEKQYESERFARGPSLRPLAILDPTVDGVMRYAAVATTLSQFAVEVEANAVAKGFRPMGRCDDREAVAVFVSNEHSEVSELWEAYRAGKLHEPCDKPGLGLTCAEEELADVVIRAMDASRALGVDLGAAVVAKHKYNLSRPRLHGGKKA